MSGPLLWMADVAAGLALEAEALAAKDPLVCLWTARAPALVCPAAFRHRPGFDEAALRSAERGWPVHLRPTGGGVVPQGRGVLNLELAFTAGREFSIEAGYRLLTDVIRDALAPHHTDLTSGAIPNSFCDGAWNLSIRGQKVVGTAQRIRPQGSGQRRILAHALILTDGEIASGTGAVNALHDDLDLPPVATEAHTTLAKAFGPNMADPATFAGRLEASAKAAFATPVLYIAA